MPIVDLSSSEVIKISKTKSIIDAAKLMKEHNIGNVIVVENEEENKPVGTLTDRDIVMQIAADGLDIEATTLDKVMSTDLLMLNNDQGVKEAIDAMREKGVRRAPVIDDENNIIGIVTADDLLTLIADELSSLAEIVHKQIES